VSAEAIEESVRRLLEAKLRMGLFDNPYVDEERAREVLADPQHREVAGVAAERAAVLLRDEDNLLPLDLEQVSSIAVIGPLADSRRDTIGPWVFAFDLDETVTVLAAIRAKVGDRMRVDYAQGVPVVQRVFPSMFDMFGRNRPTDPEGFDEDAEFERAVQVASSADVAVVVLGEFQNMIGEAASRSSLELPGRQLKLLQAVVGTGTPMVLLVMNGRPLDLRWAADNVPAILDIWHPGTQGGHSHRLSQDQQHFGPGSHRSHTALPPPAPRLGGSSCSRAQGFPARDRTGTILARGSVRARPRCSTELEHYYPRLGT
jgi:beta-glucosidase